MAGTFKFELVSPERILMSADASQAVIPGAEGDFTVLEGHAPVVSTLRPGVIAVTVDGSEKKVFVKGGFVEVEPASVTVLTETAIDFVDVDLARVAREIEIVEKDLAEGKSDEARLMASQALEHLKAITAAH